MVSQQELAQKYQEVLDIGARGQWFEDATKCDVCGSSNVHFTQKLNGVLRTCVPCEEYLKTYRTNRGTRQRS